MDIESIIISNLIFNEKYTRKVIPFLKDEYYQKEDDRALFKLINDYLNKYNSLPSKEALLIDLSNKSGINEDTFKKVKDKIEQAEEDKNTKLDWLVDQTEKFCQDRAIYNGIMKSIKILDGDPSTTKGAIPQILSDAIAVSFDTHIGHDFIEDADDRFEFYHTKQAKIPFDLEYFNKITNGGLPKKTLNICIAGVGVGKSLFMCHCAAANLMQGLNVLYITLELAEERVAERIDANLLNCTIDDIKMLPKDMFLKKIGHVRGKTNGRLVIKEYPTSCAGSANFRHLLGELKIKKNFIPDVIYIDYLNICMSSRIRSSNGVNSYTMIKAIAEELRGLAVEFNVPIISATQVNRSGFTNSDFGMEDTAESFGLPATADLMFALIVSEEMKNLNQILVKQLKNRYSDVSMNTKFVIGVDKSKMRLYDVEQSAQGLSTEEKPVMDNTTFGFEDAERNKPKPKFRKGFR